jgi:hypothetical protein
MNVSLIMAPREAGNDVEQFVHLGMHDSEVADEANFFYIQSVR